MNIFGQNYEEIGSSNQGLILKSSGKIKLQWGKKFIDLIDSNGNINCKVLDIIKSVNSLEGINKNGLYYCNGKLIAKIGASQIDLGSETSEETEETAESKLAKLKSVGLIYETRNDSNIYPTEGIVYFLDELKLYKVADGLLYSFDTLNNLLVINKNDSKEGALLVVGQGKENGVRLDNLNIYSSEGSSNYESSSQHSFYINDKSVFNVTNDGIYTPFGFNVFIDDDGESVISIDKIELKEEKGDIFDTLVLTNLNVSTLKSIKLVKKSGERFEDITTLTASRSPQTLTLNNEAGEYRIYVECNTKWSINISEEDYITNTIKEGVGPFNYTFFDLSIAANNSGENRTAYLSIYDMYYDRLIEFSVPETDKDHLFDLEAPNDTISKHRMYIKLVLLG